MRTSIYICGYEEAVKFAKANNIEDWRIRDIQPNNNLQGFNIEEYCKVVQVYRFKKYIDGASGELSQYYFTSDCHAILMLVTGEILRPFERKRNKFALYPLEQQMLNHVQDFNYEEPEPNLIGVPTIKKIDAWISYIHMKETARINYNNAAILRNKTFADKFKAKYPNVNYRTLSDGWVSSFTIEYGAFYFKYTSGTNGQFYREVSIIYKNVPTDEELLA